MQIKGTAVKVTPEYVKEKFADKYVDWLKLLPEASKNIIDNPIYATTWYDLYDAVIMPTMKVGELFFGNDQVKAARELGMYSADVALKGIYKIFVRVSSPEFVISRATNVFSTYYNPSDIKIVEKGNKRVTLQLAQFNRKEELIMTRIGGWMEKTLEITLKSDIAMEIAHNYDGDNLTTNITAIWK